MESGQQIEQIKNPSKKELAKTEIENLLKNLTPEDKKDNFNKSDMVRALENIGFLNKSLAAQPNFRSLFSEENKGVILTGGKTLTLKLMARKVATLTPEFFWYDSYHGQGVMFAHAFEDFEMSRPAKPNIETIAKESPRTFKSFANMSKEALLKKVLKGI